MPVDLFDAIGLMTPEQARRVVLLLGLPKLRPLLKQKELQEHSGISKWTADRWIAAGCSVRRLPSGHKRFDIDAVDAWINAQQHPASRRIAADAIDG